MSLLLKEYLICNEYLTKILNLSKQMNENNTYYLAKDMSLIVKILSQINSLKNNNNNSNNSIDSRATENFKNANKESFNSTNSVNSNTISKVNENFSNTSSCSNISVPNQEILDLFEEILVFLRKNKYSIEYYNIKAKYLEYISLYKEKHSNLLKEINKVIEEMWINDGQIFSDPNSNENITKNNNTETSIFNIAFGNSAPEKSVFNTNINEFYTINTSNISNNTNKDKTLNYNQELYYRNYIKIITLLKLYRILNQCYFSHKACLILINILKFADITSLFSGFVKYAYNEILEKMGCSNISFNKISSYKEFLVIHNILSQSQNKDLLFDVRENEEVELIQKEFNDKDGNNNNNGSFVNLNIDIKRESLFHRIKKELFNQTETSIKENSYSNNKDNPLLDPEYYTREFTKRRLEKNQQLNIYSRSSFIKDYILQPSYETVQHQLILSYIHNNNNESNNNNVTNFLSVYNNSERTNYSSSLFIDKKIYELFLLQSLSSYLSIEQQNYISTSLLNNTSVSMLSNNGFNRYHLVKLPYLVKVIPLICNIKFEKNIKKDILNSKDDSNKNNGVFLYNPWGKDDGIEYYWTIGSYQNVLVELTNNLDIDITMNKIRIVFDNSIISKSDSYNDCSDSKINNSSNNYTNEVPFSFPCKSL